VAYVVAINRYVVFDERVPARSTAAADARAASDGPFPGRGGGSVGGAAVPDVSFFDGGFAVGPHNQIVKVIADRIRGSHTACEQPAPTPEERASWRKGEGRYAHAAMSELLLLPDSDLEAAVSTRLEDKIYGAGYAAMSREERNVYLVYMLRTEVEMDGLSGFFEGSSGNCAMRTALAFDEMDAASDAHAYRQALALFPDGSPSEDRSARLDQVEALGRVSRRWHAMDERLSGGLQGTAGYIRAHSGAFALPP
jgi:hypothetical protein